MAGREEGPAMAAAPDPPPIKRPGWSASPMAPGKGEDMRLHEDFIYITMDHDFLKGCVYCLTRES